jgi:hypothetical protein
MEEVLGRASSVVFSLFLAAGLCATAGIAGAQSSPDFGSPPSGQYPILYNDQHVYTKPDVDKQNRVLAALVRGKTILVPLRSMFEQMGAVVEFDPATKTAIVSKPGSEIRVTVGKPEVIINGESRPLDVPPEMHDGDILVPVRVISEGMGAYVQWVPEKRVVVVRYVPAPPPPPPATPIPTPAPTVPPTPQPIPSTTFATPAPVVTPYAERYIEGDYIVAPKVYNEFTSAASNSSGQDIRGAVELPMSIHLLLEGEYSVWNWPHPAGPVTALGHGGSSLVAAFSGKDQNLTGDFGIRIMGNVLPRVYFIEGYMSEWSNYNYPRIGGIGYGLEKLPDLDHVLSVYGRYWYGQNIKGRYPPVAAGGVLYPAGSLAYHLQKYDVGFNWLFAGVSAPVYFDAGFQGEGWHGGITAPSDRLYYGPYAGFGIKF